MLPCYSGITLRGPILHTSDILPVTWGPNTYHFSNLLYRCCLRGESDHTSSTICTPFEGEGGYLYQ